MNKPSSPKVLLALGKEAYDNQDFQQAEQVLTTLTEEHGGFADAYHLLGKIYYNWGDYPRAQGAFEKAIAINPAYIEASLHLAITLSDMGKYEEADTLYERVQSIRASQPKGLDLYLKSKIANLYASIGTIYVESFLYEEAAAEFLRALALCPDFPDIRLKLADTYREQKAYDKAIAEYQTLRDKHPNYIPALHHLGLCHYSQEDKAQARIVWEEALALDPENAQTRAYLRSLETQHHTPELGPSPEQDDSETLDATELLAEAETTLE